MDLYQTFIKSEDKNFETHFIENTLVETNVEVNNALIENNPLALVGVKFLEVTDFFEDCVPRISHHISGRLPRLDSS